MSFDPRWETVPYFHGRILDIGANQTPLFPHFIHHQSVRVDEPETFSIFANGSLDGVFSHGLLNLLSEEEASKTLAQFIRVVRIGGHIVLDIPLKDVNKWEVSRNSIMKLMGKHHGWELLECKERVVNDHPGWWCVFKVAELGKAVKETQWPDKTCAVIRYGAFGDMIQASSIFPWLKEQGYHVTLFCSDTGYDVVKHDPHVDRFVIQGKDEVPPDWLDEFWNYEKKKYTKWVNLCESVEGTLLPPADSLRASWPDEVRGKYLDVNYLEFTHELAEVPPPYRPKFYATPAEKEWARKEKKGRAVLWSLAGSSVHKTWPHLDAIVARIMLHYKDVDVYLVGDEASQILEQGWQKEKRVHCKSGRWTIRQSMAFAEVADLIVGTETGLLNAAGSLEVPKIVTLSHSSEEMLTKHWKNAIALKQPRGCPKFPCRRLHRNWDHCMKHEDTGTAMCQFMISPDQMWAEVVKILGN